MVCLLFECQWFVQVGMHSVLDQGWWAQTRPSGLLDCGETSDSGLSGNILVGSK